MEVLRYANLDTVPLKHKIRVQIQESGLLGAADGIIAHNPVMKSVLVDKGIAEDKIVSLGIFDYLIPNFQEKSGQTKDQPIIVAVSYTHLDVYKRQMIYFLTGIWIVQVLIKQLSHES